MRLGECECRETSESFVWAQIGRIRFEFIVLCSHSTQTERETKVMFDIASCVCVCVWECDRHTLLPANANSQSVVKLINNIILSCRFSIPIMCVLSLFSDSLALLVVYIYCIFYSCLLSCPTSDIVLHHNCSRLRIRTIKCRSFDVTYEVITSISRWYNCTWNNKWNRSLSMHFDRHSPLHTIYPSLPEQFFVRFVRISINVTSI